MKRFLAISIALIGFAIDALCCGYGYYSNHNNYMFSVFRREMMQGPVSAQELNKFWNDYTNGEVETFEWGKDEVLETAKKKGDREMADYVTQLIRYVDISRDLQDSWSYPTKEELKQRKEDLNTMLQKSIAYNGKRLQGQWHLLHMRANMVLGDHAANITFWNQTGSKLPQSIYKTMMESIYAGALLHTGKQREAVDIYAKNGDLLSIKWAMRKYRNLAGIQRIYEESPNSPCMSFLIQDFVNNTQETLDCNRNDDNEFCADYMKEIDARSIKRQEADQFIKYAQNVISAGKTEVPALWQSAIGELQYLNGQYAEAYASLDKAVGMKGTSRMLDNARAIRMIASVKANNLDSKYTKWMASEMEWLIGKIREEATDNPSYSSDGEYYYLSYNHYYDILDRLVYQELAPKYERAGRSDMAIALKGMISKPENLLHKKQVSTIEDWNPNYNGEFFDALDALSADNTIGYLEFLQSKKGDNLEQLVRSYADDIDLDYFNELTGTKFLAENQFDKAIPYLQKVPLSFLENQNICCYLANRDWHKSKWIVNQRESIFNSSEGPRTNKLTHNPKLEFCKEMVELQKKYKRADKASRPQVAYDLANNYFQASYLGDCWFLTQYGSSCNDTARADRPDFVQYAVNYLEESKVSSNLKLQENSLFGLAFIPLDPWQETKWDDASSDWIDVVNRSSRQYKALGELNRFVKSHPREVSSYVSRCDVLRQFRKNE